MSGVGLVNQHRHQGFRSLGRRVVGVAVVDVALRGLFDASLVSMAHAGADGAHTLAAPICSRLGGCAWVWV